MIDEAIVVWYGWDDDDVDVAARSQLLLKPRRANNRSSAQIALFIHFFGRFLPTEIRRIACGISELRHFQLNHLARSSVPLLIVIEFLE